MKKITGACLALIIFIIASCDKKNKDLETPLKDFPQVVMLADEDDGEIEDEDKFSFKITLADRPDPSGSEPGGTVVPLEKNVTVQFAITDHEGFAQLQDYIIGAEAFYEIDDCTTSLDQGEDLDLQFNIATGIGSVTFPAGVEEIEIEFETDAALFDDNVFNNSERSLTIQLTDLIGNEPGVTVNKTAEFTHHVLDDEGIYGEWELDVNDAAEFAKFKNLFGLINEDIANLDAADVDEIAIEFEYGEVKAIVVLNETETVDDCGTPSVEHKVIEVEAEIEDIEDDSQNGDLEFAEMLELINGALKEFVYKGSFAISGTHVSLTLEGEFNDQSTNAITLELDK